MTHRNVLKLCTLAAICATLILQGCNSTQASTPAQRSQLHGAPLTEADLAQLARSAKTPEDVAIEARLRGFAFPWRANTRASLSKAGLEPPLIERLANIASQPDTLGNQSRAGDAPLTAVGVVGIAAALGAVTWLIIELIEDDDHHHHHRRYRHHHGW